METVATSAEHVRGLGLALEKERGASLEEKEAAYRARAALLEVPVVYVLVVVCGVGVINVWSACLEGEVDGVWMRADSVWRQDKEARLTALAAQVPSCVFFCGCMCVHEGMRMSQCHVCLELACT